MDRQDRHEFPAYDRLRFFTVTGEGTGAIVERQAQLDEIIARMFEPSPNGAPPKNKTRAPRSQTSDTARDQAQRSVEELIKEFPKLGEIIKHKCKAPKDASQSGWITTSPARAAAADSSKVSLPRF